MQTCKASREPPSVKNAEVNSVKVFRCNRKRESPHLQSCNGCCRAERNGYESIQHPAYSPGLAPSHFFLFPNLIKVIRGCHFRSDEEIVTAVEELV